MVWRCCEGVLTEGNRTDSNEGGERERIITRKEKQEEAAKKQERGRDDCTTCFACIAFDASMGRPNSSRWEHWRVCAARPFQCVPQAIPVAMLNPTIWPQATEPPESRLITIHSSYRSSRGPAAHYCSLTPFVGWSRSATTLLDHQGAAGLGSRAKRGGGWRRCLPQPTMGCVLECLFAGCTALHRPS